MSKDILSNLSFNELQENANRLEVAAKQLLELLQGLEEEQQELVFTKEMMVNTLMEIAPREEKLMERVFSKARNMWSELWKKDTVSEDKEEWSKIMRELE